MLSATIFYPKFLLFSIIDDPFLPMGTFVAWFALIAINFQPYLLSKRLRSNRSTLYRILRPATYFLSTLAILWVLISRVLAGNWNYTFKSTPDFVGSVLAGEIFELFWKGLVIGPLVILIIIFIDTRIMNRD